MGMLAGLFVRLVVGAISAALQLAVVLVTLLAQLLVAILPHLVRAVGQLFRALFQLVAVLSTGLVGGFKSTRSTPSDDRWDADEANSHRDEQSPPANQTQRPRRVPKSYW